MVFFFPPAARDHLLFLLRFFSAASPFSLLHATDGRSPRPALSPPRRKRCNLPFSFFLWFRPGAPFGGRSDRYFSVESFLFAIALFSTPAMTPLSQIFFFPWSRGATKRLPFGALGPTMGFFFFPQPHETAAGPPALADFRPQAGASVPSPPGKRQRECGRSPLPFFLVFSFPSV